VNIKESLLTTLLIFASLLLKDLIVEKVKSKKRKQRLIVFTNYKKLSANKS
jgi:hypothetical protein